MVVLEYLYARWLRMEIAHNTPCVVGKLYRINQVTKLLEKIKSQGNRNSSNANNANVGVRSIG